MQTDRIVPESTFRRNRFADHHLLRPPRLFRKRHIVLRWGVSVPDRTNHQPHMTARSPLDRPRKPPPRAWRPAGRLVHYRPGETAMSRATVFAVVVLLTSRA